MDLIGTCAGDSGGGGKSPRSVRGGGDEPPMWAGSETQQCVYAPIGTDGVGALEPWKSRKGEKHKHIGNKRKAEIRRKKADVPGNP